MNCPFCKIDIDEHEAGDCLDAWICQSIFNELPEKRDCAHGSIPVNKDGTIFLIPFYSTDMGAAWKVVEKVKKRWMFLSWTGKQWNIGFHEQTVAFAPTAPLAIVRAAIKAVAELIEKEEG